MFGHGSGELAVTKALTAIAIGTVVGLLLGIAATYLGLSFSDGPEFPY